MAAWCGLDAGGLKAEETVLVSGARGGLWVLAAPPRSLDALAPA
jgi:hypothetical protein